MDAAQRERSRQERFEWLRREEQRRQGQGASERATELLGKMRRSEDRLRELDGLLGDLEQDQQARDAEAEAIDAVLAQRLAEVGGGVAQSQAPQETAPEPGTEHLEALRSGDLVPGTPAYRKALDKLWRSKTKGQTFVRPL
jgi:hypothetical protein